jgi:hypothetical protein
MKRRILAAALATFSAAGIAAATDLNINIRSGGLNVVDVPPRATVAYTITGTLSDSASLGLAMFSLDLTYSGGALAQAANPTSDPMQRFASPQGMTNPAGFGGTLSAGKLLQVGGAQNTINNTLAPKPNGMVLTNVAQPSSPAVLAQGTVVAPSAPGVYTLTANHLFANVIRTGETGTPFWHVDACGAGTNQGLTIRVGALHPGHVTVPVHHPLALNVDAGVENAGRRYMLLGSVSGTAPGTTIESGVHVPLNADEYLRFTEQNPNSAILAHSFGVLDEHGRASATFTPDARFVDKTVNHAFVVLGPTRLVIEAQACQVVP